MTTAWIWLDHLLEYRCKSEAKSKYIEYFRQTLNKEEEKNSNYVRPNPYKFK